MNTNSRISVTLAVAQLNLTVGDVVGNADAIIAAIVCARAAGADLLLTPRIGLVGLSA